MKNLQLVKAIVLGVRLNVEYETYEFLLDPGDALILYTDGITEAENDAYELFGDNQ